MADVDCRIIRYGDSRELYDNGRTNEWVDMVRVMPPSFVFVNVCPLSTHIGTGLENKMIHNLNRLLNACNSSSKNGRQCVL